MLIVICALVAVLLIILFSDLKVGALYVYDEKASRLSVTAGIGFLKISIADTGKKEMMPVETAKEVEGTVENKFEGMRQTFRDVFDIFKFLKKRLKLRYVKFHITFGTGNAAQTAILSGLAWALPYELLAIVDNQFILKKHDIKVSPDFNSEVFEVDFGAEISLMTIFAIAAGFKFYRSQKGRKGK